MMKALIILAYISLVSSTVKSQDTYFIKIIKANFDTLSANIYGPIKPEHSSVMRARKFMEDLTGIESTADILCYGGKQTPNYQDYVSWANWFNYTLKNRPWSIKYGIPKRTGFFQTTL